MASRFKLAKEQHEEAARRFQRAALQGSTAEMSAALDAVVVAAKKLDSAAAGRLTQLQRAARKYAEAMP